MAKFAHLPLLPRQVYRLLQGITGYYRVLQANSATFFGGAISLPSPGSCYDVEAVMLNGSGHLA